MSAFGRPSNTASSTLFTKPNHNTANNQRNSSANGFNDNRRSGNGPNKQKGNQRNGGRSTSGNFNNSNNNSNNASNGNSNGNSGANNALERKKQGLRNAIYQRKLQKENSEKAKSEPPTTANDPLDIPTRIIPPQGPVKTLNYDANELIQTGQLISHPEHYGFQRNNKKVRPRPVPKYLLAQSRLLHTPKFVQNQWDIENQQRMSQMENQNGGKDFQGLYEVFQKMRETERKQMEVLGLVDAENISKDLNDAISFQGTCVDMCPVFERVRRALENNVKALEKDPATGKIAKERAVKAFSRPAAGQPPPLPSEVRPPHVLKQTLDYLVDNIVDMLPEAHSFIWDRTRSIRQDFTYQNSFGPEAIDCNERIVRIHLLSLHVMAGSEIEYSQQQELEQFNKALQTLVEIYQDVRNHGGVAPNEAEFRAYHLLSHIRDPELEREIQNLPSDIFQDKHIQLALHYRSIISQNNVVERGFSNSVGALNFFVEFFNNVYDKKTPFLMTCLLETHFSEIRFYALKAMARSYHTKGKAYSVEALKRTLGFDSSEKLVKFVSYYDIDTIQDKGELLVDLFNKEKLETKYKLNSVHDKPKYPPIYSSQIDEKIRGLSFKEIINSGRLNGDLALDKPNFTSRSTPAVPNFQTLPPINNTPVASFNQPANTFSSPAVQSIQANKPQEAFGFNTAQLPPMSSDKTSTMSIPTSTKQQSLPSFDFKPPPVQSSTASNPLSVPSAKVETDQKKQPFSFSLRPNDSKSASPLSESKPITKTETLSFSDSSLSKPIKTGTTLSAATDHLHQVEQKKKLSSLSQFPVAVNIILNDMIKASVDAELSSLLPKLIRSKNRQSEHRKVIETLSVELYDAFLSEIIYQTTLEERAKEIQEKNLKLKVIRKISSIGSVLQKKHELKRQKLGELRSISFKLPEHKRRLSSASPNDSQILKKRLISQEGSSVNIIQKQTMVHELWSPIDFERFLRKCSSNIKLNIESDNVELKFLLVVENWASPYSKWLNTKLELKSNLQKLIYEKTIQNDKLLINFLSLPKGDYLNKEFFSNASFILFECGFTSTTSGYKSIFEKLQRDRTILEKLVSLIDKFSYYKAQILILFWDASDSGISSSEVADVLTLTEFESRSNVNNIVLCDMSTQDSNINEVLTGAFDKISNSFDGELTTRGSLISNLTFRNRNVNSTLLNLNSSHMNDTTLNNTSMNNASILTGFGNGVIEESTPASSPNSKSKFTRPDSKIVPKKIQQLRDLTAGIKSRYKK
ncbi:SAC3/GANP/Nin1/mts3/eIF-3 p25 family-domain-containing protein [Scheffersomyces xylosifermentans]|uniref:SAC3/GANP/Nin1/mts3/eIF-3 p25 family-domain-containing protein n=1 Tax=Scheffersomyces xylosifermentans TaxID=1304137 RepID=UPI00315DFBAB